MTFSLGTRFRCNDSEMPSFGVDGDHELSLRADAGEKEALTIRGELIIRKPRKFGHLGDKILQRGGFLDAHQRREARDDRSGRLRCRHWFSVAAMSTWILLNLFTSLLGGKRQEGNDIEKHEGNSGVQ